MNAGNKTPTPCEGSSQPNPTPAPDMAVEAIRVVEQTAWISVVRGNEVLGSFYRPDGRKHAQMFADALRAALARPQEVARVTEADFVEHSHPEYGPGHFCTPDVFARIAASRAPVAVGVEPVQIGEGFFLPDGFWSGSASRVPGYLRMVENDEANGCTIRPIYAFPAGAGGSVGAEPNNYQPFLSALAPESRRRIEQELANGRPIWTACLVEGFTLGKNRATPAPSVPLGVGEVLKDEAIGAAWDAAKARLAHDPYTPKEAFWAGAIFGAAHPLQAQDAAPVEPFLREHRYVVFKVSDINRVPAEKKKQIYDLAQWFDERRVEENRSPMTCVVVEHDWPEYEPTWSAIQQRMENTK